MWVFPLFVDRDMWKVWGSGWAERGSGRQCWRYKTQRDGERRRETEKRSISSIFFQKASQDETVREVAVKLVERGGWIGKQLESR